MKKKISVLLAAAMVAGSLTAGAATPVQAADKTLRFLDVNPSETRQSYYEGIFAKALRLFMRVFRGMMQPTRLLFLALPDSFRM